MLTVHNNQHYFNLSTVQFFQNPILVILDFVKETTYSNHQSKRSSQLNFLTENVEYIFGSAEFPISIVACSNAILYFKNATKKLQNSNFKLFTSSNSEYTMFCRRLNINVANVPL